MGLDDVAHDLVAYFTVGKPTLGTGARDGV